MTAAASGPTAARRSWTIPLSSRAHAAHAVAHSAVRGIGVEAAGVLHLGELVGHGIAGGLVPLGAGAAEPATAEVAGLPARSPCRSPGWDRAPRAGWRGPPPGRRGDGWACASEPGPRAATAPATRTAASSVNDEIVMASPPGRVHPLECRGRNLPAPPIRQEIGPVGADWAQIAVDEESLQPETARPSKRSFPLGHDARRALPPSLQGEGKGNQRLNAFSSLQGEAPSDPASCPGRGMGG